MTETPEQHSRRSRVLRWSAWAALPAAAVLVAYLATRSRAEPERAAEHQHGAPATESAAQPVMLTSDQAQRIGVTYAVAESAPLAREIRTVAQVSYDETRISALSLKVDGWIETLYVNFTGQSIAAGTPLLAIYSPMLVTAQEELLLAKRLVADVAGGDADARANAASLLTAARRRLAYWDVPTSDIERIEQSAQVERTLTLRAPVTGYVVDKNVLQGSRVMAGDPLYRIADLTTVWVEGEVFERDLPSVRLGQSVRADFDALGGATRTGTITYIHPTLNTETRTVRVRVELRNPGVRLKPGMYATLVWRSTGAPTVTVPRTAVVSTGQRDLLFVKRADGMLEPRVITIGASSSERVEVLSGVAVGDTVVKSATFLLDAESNLSTLLGGMGAMPGMDMTAPARSGDAKAAVKLSSPKARADSMPGMDMSAPKKPEGSHARQNH